MAIRIRHSRRISPPEHWVRVRKHIIIWAALLSCIAILSALFISRSIRPGPREELPGVSMGFLSPAQRAAVVEELNNRVCPCGCKFTLTYCRNYDQSCRTSLTLAQEVVDALQD